MGRGFKNPPPGEGVIPRGDNYVSGGVLGRLIHRGRTLRPSIALLVARRNVW